MSFSSSHQIDRQWIADGTSESMKGKDQAKLRRVLLVTRFPHRQGKSNSYLRNIQNKGEDSFL